MEPHSKKHLTIIRATFQFDSLKLKWFNKGINFFCSFSGSSEMKLPCYKQIHEQRGTVEGKVWSGKPALLFTSSKDIGMLLISRRLSFLLQKVEMRNIYLLEIISDM